MDRGQVRGGLGSEDLQQDGVDGSGDTLLFRRRAGHFLLRRGRRGSRLQGFAGRRRRHGLVLDRRLGHGGFVAHLLARGNAVGDRLHRGEVGRHRIRPGQRGAELGQHFVRLPDQRDHGRAGIAAAIENPVEHVLDLPAELAQRTCADEPPAALQGVEDAADRAHLLGVVGRVAPALQQIAKVRDLLVELLQEHLADVVVDVGAVLEPAHGRTAAGGLFRCRGRRRSGRHGGLRRRCGSTFPGHASGFGPRLHGRGGRLAARLDGRGRSFGFLRRVGKVHAQRGRRAVAIGKADRRVALGHRDRHRPVAQRLQALAGDVEDAVAVRPLLAQGLQVVLDAGQRVGHGVQLAAVGHAPAPQQLQLDVAADAQQVFRGRIQVEDAQGTADLVEQARDLGELGVVPAGLDEGHECLPRIAEVGDRLADHHLQHAARFGGHQVGVGAVVGQAEPGDLLVQRRVDVEQRTGDVQQRGLVGRAVAGDDRVHRVALLQHHAAGHAQAHHAERIADPAEGLNLRTQVLDPGLAGAQVQVQDILDPQQVFLDRRRDRVQQRAVASAQAAAGVLDLGLAGQLRVQLEGVAQPVQCRMAAVAVGDVVEQLAGRFGIRLLSAEAGVGERAAGLALDSAEGRAQCARGLQRAVAKRAGHRRGDPEHAPQRFDGHLRQQLVDRPGKCLRVTGRAVLGPLRQRVAQRRDGRAGRARRGAHGRRRGVRRRQVLRQRPVQVRREQDALVEAGFPAGGAQLVEQGQQHDRDVAVPALQPLEVVRQLHGAAHEHRAGVLAVVDPAMDERQRQPLHLLGHHRRGVQLDHPQRAVDLVQQAGTGAHVLDLPQRLGERLDLLAGQPQGLVELGLDPAEGGGVDRVAHHCHWSSPPAAGPGAGPAVRRVLAAIRRSAPPSGRELEVGDRATQVGRQLRQVPNRLCGLVGALAGLRGDLLDGAHGVGDVGRRPGLLLRGL